MPLIARDVARVPRSPTRMPMRDGLLYEPRAFWSVGRIDTETSSARPPNQLVLNRDHFYNGEKYPITLLYACVAPIGYVFDTYLADDVDPPTQANFRNCGAAVASFGDLRIAARQRQHYAKIPVPSQALVPRPRWEPSMQDLDPDSSASSLYNVFRWDFDAPMIIPARGDLEYWLSTWLAPGGDGWPDPPEFDPPPSARILFEEIGTGPFGANSRLSALFDLLITRTPTEWQNALWGADGFGSSTPTQNTTPGQWQPTHRFSARSFAAQNKDSDGSIPMTSCAVMIDQMDYDTDVAAQAPGSGIVASLGSRVGTRARMRHGGTGAWWWREGAPLCLVSPHRTTAQVFEFREPITLGPGDSLEVEVDFPTAPTVGQTVAHSVQQLGISFCGHAAISG